jgi:phosphatidylethanolamine/phosphatidyl-N-methylethanolamine N-methyltransferase
MFFRQWLKSPLKMAATQPSSPQLARAMAAAAQPGRDGDVIEFGAGTGAITAALVEAGVHPSRLILFEPVEAFADLLARRYPQARVMRDSAYEAPELLRGIEAAAFVSGLPLIQYPERPRIAFVRGCLHDLGRAGARFVQLTYMPFSSVPLHKTPELASDVSGKLTENFPPARVWSYWLR